MAAAVEKSRAAGHRVTEIGLEKKQIVELLRNVRRDYAAARQQRDHNAIEYTTSMNECVSHVPASERGPALQYINESLLGIPNKTGRIVNSIAHQVQAQRAKTPPSQRPAAPQSLPQQENRSKTPPSQRASKSPAQQRRQDTAPVVPPSHPAPAPVLPPAPAPVQYAPQPAAPQYAVQHPMQFDVQPQYWNPTAVMGGHVAYAAPPVATTYTAPVPQGFAYAANYAAPFVPHVAPYPQHGVVQHPAYGAYPAPQQFPSAHPPPPDYYGAGGAPARR
jgi:hypothetical protein